MKKEDVIKLLTSRQFDPTAEPPEEVVVFRIQFNNIGSLGNFILITGRPKAGKSKYIAGALAAGIYREEVFGLNIRLPEDKRKIVHFDTEQSKHDYHKMLKLVNQLVDKQTFPKHFFSYHCRQEQPHQIIAMIDYFLSVNPDVGVIFLDGLLDVIESFNDEKHSKALVNWMKRITDHYNVLLVGVLHRSMSADKSIGHLGSSADRAAQSVLIVERDKERKQYILKAEYLRSADDFNPIAICYNAQLSIWQQTDYLETTEKRPGSVARLKQMPRELNIQDHWANTSQIFKRQRIQSYKTLIQNIIEVYATGNSWAKECIKYLQAENIIFHTPDGYTNEQQAKLVLLESKK